MEVHFLSFRIFIDMYHRCFFFICEQPKRTHKGNESILCWQSTLVVDGFVVLFSVKYTPK